VFGLAYSARTRSVMCDDVIVLVQDALRARHRIMSDKSVMAAIFKHFNVMTAWKPAGRRWLTKEQVCTSCCCRVPACAVHVSAVHLFRVVECLHDPYYHSLLCFITFSVHNSKMTCCAINPCVLAFVRTSTCCSAKCVVHDHDSIGLCVLVAVAFL
jgi:hypothetical protein